MAEMVQRLETHSDCNQCAALCCIAYPSEDMPGFAAAKAAGEACPKLDRCGRCTIYDRRVEEGFGGCVRYECFGAGQHVVQGLFRGTDWRDDSSFLGPMVEAFLSMRPVSDLLYLAEHAAKSGLSQAARSELEAVRAELEDAASTTAKLSDTARIERLRARIARIYASLDRDRAGKS